MYILAIWRRREILAARHSLSVAWSVDAQLVVVTYRPRPEIRREQFRHSCVCSNSCTMKRTLPYYLRPSIRTRCQPFFCFFFFFCAFLVFVCRALSFFLPFFFGATSLQMVWQAAVATPAWPSAISVATSCSTFAPVTTCSEERHSVSPFQLQ